MFKKHTDPLRRFHPLTIVVQMLYMLDSSCGSEACVFGGRQESGSGSETIALSPR